MMHPTSSQTIGPFWHLHAEPALSDLTRFGAEGPRIVITGCVTDGDGAPVTDASVEIAQVSPPVSDRFPGWGRCATDGEGCFRFVTVKPEPAPGRGGSTQAPHVAVTLLARGLLKALFTRCYFQGEPLNQTDPLLSSIEDPARRKTLIARTEGGDAWTLDIRLQGEGETVFLEITT
jgi:protocatechuate 3,4-dioxygenase, alpha subunit